MKSYGRIDFEAHNLAVSEAEFPDESVETAALGEIWNAIKDMQRGWEAGAQAVIEEFKRRHNIVISPEED